jgi:hypothetical protein
MTINPRLIAFGVAALACQTAALSQGPAPGIYGATPGFPGQFGLYSISPSSGVPSLIGSTVGYGLYRMAFSPNGVLYAIGFNGLNFGLLLTINPSTGAALAGPLFTGGPAQTIGAFGGVVTEYPPPTDLAFRSDGALFAIYSFDSALYTISPATGVATPLGTAGAVSGQTLAFDANNVLYVADNINLYTVNQSTAVATIVAPLSFDPAFGTGPFILSMRFDATTGKLYAAVSKTNTQQSFLALVNRSTGGVASIGPVAGSVDGTTLGLGAIAIPPTGVTGPVPAPALSIPCLLALGCLLLVVVARLSTTAHPAT